MRRSGKVGKWVDRLQGDKPENEKVCIHQTSLCSDIYSLLAHLFLSLFLPPSLPLGHQKIDPEIFDDVDFYSQLLKELMDSSVDTNDPIGMSQAWLKSREGITKLKKNVDRKASKSRRLKYTVHEKLLNFMAPKDDVSSPPEGLYESLFR